jgi:conjugal transfer/entry exclusion protein
MSVLKITGLAAMLGLSSVASQAVPVFPDSNYSQAVASVEQVLGLSAWEQNFRTGCY